MTADLRLTTAIVGESPDYIVIDAGDGACYVQRKEPDTASGRPLDASERLIFRLLDLVKERDAELARLRARLADIESKAAEWERQSKDLHHNSHLVASTLRHCAAAIRGEGGAT